MKIECTNTLQMIWKTPGKILIKMTDIHVAPSPSSYSGRVSVWRISNWFFIEKNVNFFIR